MLQQASQVVSDLQQSVSSAVGPATGGCCGDAANSQVNTKTGNLSFQVTMPTVVNSGVNPTLYYNSTKGESGDWAYGWRGQYDDTVIEVDATTANVIKSNGSVRRYTNLDENGLYQAPSGVRNSLAKTEDGWAETQPDGVAYNYNSSGKLEGYERPGWGEWRLRHDESGNLSHVEDPAGRRTTYGYDINGGIRRIEDVASRITTFVVNDQGDLIQFMSPEQCVTQLRYDALGRMSVSIAPTGGLRRRQPANPFDRSEGVHDPASLRRDRPAC